MPFTIRLNVYRNSDTAEIYVSAPVSEPGFKFYAWDKETHDVRFHHHPVYDALRDHRMPNNRNEDFYVDFDVTMSFPAFCKILRESEWNNPNKHNPLTHNCAHAAAFALEIAGIKLKLPGRFDSNRMNDLSYLKMPGFVLTPYELYDIARKHQQNEWEKNQKNHLEILRAKNELTLLKMKNDPEARSAIDNMLKKFDESLEKNPHHAKEYKNALTGTIARLTQQTDPVIKDAYSKTAAFFDKRKPSQQKRYWDEFLMLKLLLVSGACYIGSVIGPVIDSQPFLQRSIMNWAWMWCVYKVTSTVQGYHSYIRLADEHERLKTPVETDLSKAMRDLSTDVTLQTLQRR